MPGPASSSQTYSSNQDTTAPAHPLAGAHRHRWPWTTRGSARRNMSHMSAFDQAAMQRHYHMLRAMNPSLVDKDLKLLKASADGQPITREWVEEMSQKHKLEFWTTNQSWESGESNVTSMMIACRYLQEDIVDHLLKSCNPRDPKYLNLQTKSGCSALHMRAGVALPFVGRTLAVRWLRRSRVGASTLVRTVEIQRLRHSRLRVVLSHLSTSAVCDMA